MPPPRNAVLALLGCVLVAAHAQAGKRHSAELHRRSTEDVSLTSLFDKLGIKIPFLGAVPSGGDRDSLSFNSDNSNAADVAKVARDALRKAEEALEGAEKELNDSLHLPLRKLSASHRIDASALSLLHARQHQQSIVAPFADGGAGWVESFRIAQDLVGKMTLEEKANMTAGANGPCIGSTGSVPRLGIPSLCFSDGPTGVRQALNVSQFPAEVTVGATWDLDLVGKRATAMAEEFRDIGINVMFAPVTGGPLGRSPQGGRNWEGFATDEYLTGRASYVSVKDAQAAGIVAGAKHFIFYEQETSRNVRTILPVLQQPIDSVVDDKTAHELYMVPFAEAIRAGAGQIMCSYNKINGTHACESSKSLAGLLKTELNFQGHVVSDYGGAWSDSTVGLDVLMPGDGLYGVQPNFFGSHGSKLIENVENGKLTETRLDDMVIRLLTPILQYQGGDLSKLLPNPDQLNVKPTGNKNVQGDHHQIIRQIGTESLTLLKNTVDGKTGSGGATGLPLDLNKIKKIAVSGQDAVSSLDNRKTCNNLGECVLKDFQGVVTTGTGSGSTTPPYIIDPLAAIRSYIAKADKDRAVTVTSSPNPFVFLGAVWEAKNADVALVFVSATAGEASDRNADLKLDHNGEDLIKAVAAANNNTIVIIHGPGPVIVEDWIDLPNIRAVLYAYYPGQEAGSSLTPVLFGDESPSGKLPFVMAKKTSDWPANTLVKTLSLNPQATFAEKLLIDWRWLDAKNIAPRFPFGFGLSYTTFSYGELQVKKQFKADSTSIQRTKEPFVSSVSPGDSLYDELFSVNLPITNTGDRTGKEVVQLYLSYPASATQQPPHALRGFAKVQIAAGQTRTVSMQLTRKDLSIWDVVQQKWVIPRGTFTLFAAKSSADWTNAKKANFTV
ncbi:glycoside hydrolase [Ceraceosorus guamensis]|uniref:Probable beta-glucosidase G n=1 Tax=Ceraceosorus guamensis TaxID=1522189 RepID=A0A316WGQ4_9BASI|nr:glycoside hydrolase [Ceraceosorus guamensis]PWN46305.1 glycoside hydrolase [Ceraceosorus guamensis]